MLKSNKLHRHVMMEKVALTKRKKKKCCQSIHKLHGQIRLVLVEEDIHVRVFWKTLAGASLAAHQSNCAKERLAWRTGRWGAKQLTA